MPYGTIVSLLLGREPGIRMTRQLFPQKPSCFVDVNREQYLRQRRARESFGAADASSSSLARFPLLSITTGKRTGSASVLMKTLPTSTYLSASYLESSMSRLCIAFLLGGLFFSKWLPRALALLAMLWQRVTRAFNPTKKSATTVSSRIRRRDEQGGGGMVHFRRVRGSGLVVFQYIAERLAGRSFQTQLRRALEESLEQVHNPNIRSIRIESFVTNPNPDDDPPRLRQGRLYETVEDVLAFDVDIEWRNCLEAEFHITTRRLGLLVPVRLYNCTFRGPVRIILTPLIQEPPGFGACLVSFPRLPEIELDVMVAGGQITRVPWFKQELMDALLHLLKQEMVWPNRNVSPSLQEQRNTTKIASQVLADLGTADPLLEWERHTMARSQPATASTQAETDKPKTSAWKKIVSGITSLFSTSKTSGRDGPSVGVRSDGASATNDTAPSEPSTGTGLAEPHGWKMAGTEKDEKRARSTERDGGLTTLWNRMLDSLLKPLEQTSESSTNTPGTSRSTNVPSNLTKVIERMADVDTLDEFISLFDNEENTS